MKNNRPTIPTATELTESYKKLSEPEKLLAIGFIQGLMVRGEPVKDDRRESA